jgi:hypothetical protein
VRFTTKADQYFSGLQNLPRAALGLDFTVAKLDHMKGDDTCTRLGMKH